MSETKRKTTNVGAIKEYFADSERPVTLGEMKELTMDDRAELGRLAAEQLGVEIDNNPPR